METTDGLNINIEDMWVNENKTSDISGSALPTLRNNRSAGREIPYSKIGRSVRYRVGDIFRYMNNRKIKTEEY